MKRTITLLFFICLSAKLAYCTPAAPSGLQTESTTNPRNNPATSEYGVERSTPLFSWNADAVQESYQIIVADNPADIIADNGNIWDSGEVVTSDEFCNYSGLTALKSNTTYFWKVRTSSSSETSPYSSYAYFETNHFLRRQAFNVTSQRMGYAVGDINGDGLRDFVEAKGNLGTVTAYVNTGTGTFTRHWQNGGGNPTDARTVALLDTDNDGDLDLIIDNGGITIKTIHYYKNNGSGSFSLDTNDLGLERPSRAIAVGDIDRDGDMDFIEGNATATDNYLYKNNGDGTFANPVVVGVAGSETNDLILADMNNDGFLDLIEANIGEENRVYLNNNGSFPGTADWESSETDDTYAIALIDYEGDGDWDFIAGNDTVKNIIYVNDGSGAGYSVAQPSETDWTYALSSGDMDNDGDMDYINGNIAARQRIYINKGGGSFVNDFCSFYTPTSSCYRLNLIDLTGNGAMDLLMGDFGPPPDHFFVHDSAISNSGPAAPSSNLYAEYNDAQKKYLFQWDHTTDDHASQNQLSYNIRIGTSSGDYQIISGAIATTDNSGSFWGNVGRSTHVYLSVKPQTLFWQVQAIDTSKSTGAWSSEQVMNEKPLSGWEADFVLLSTCASQWTLSKVQDGSGDLYNDRIGMVEIHFKAKDREKNPVILTDFQYSTSSSGAWYSVTPDTSVILTQAGKSTTTYLWPDNQGNYFVTVESTASYSAAADHMFIWDSNESTQIQGIETSEARIRFKSYDIFGATQTGYTTSLPFHVDNLDPTEPGMLSDSASFAGTQYTLLFGGQSFDTNFEEYRIYYGTYPGIGKDDYTSVWTQSDDSNLSAADFNGAPSTVINGLAEDTTYYFRIYAFDGFGNYSSTSALTVKTNDPPYLKEDATYSIEKITATQRTDGSDLVDIYFGGMDNDDEPSYIVPGECFYQYEILMATYVMTPSTYPSVLNLGKTVSTYTFVWDAGADVPDISSNTFRMRITVSDGKDQGVTDIMTNYVLDTAPPDTDNFLKAAGGGLTYINWEWHQTFEEHFTGYELWYSSVPNGSSTSSKDPGHAQCVSMPGDKLKLSTTTEGLQQLTTYWACLWIYDKYGHETHTSVYSFTTGFPPEVSIRSQPYPVLDSKGDIEVDLDVYDADGNDCRLQIEYSTNNMVTWELPTISTMSSSYGDPAAINVATVTYRVKNIPTKNGPSISTNTLKLRWVSSIDVGSQYYPAVYFRVRVKDDISESSQLISDSFKIDSSRPVPDYINTGNSGYSHYTSTSVIQLRILGENGESEVLDVTFTKANLAKFILYDSTPTPSESHTLTGSTVTASPGYLYMSVPQTIRNRVARWNAQSKTPFLRMLSSSTRDDSGNCFIEQSDFIFDSDIDWVKDTASPVVSSGSYANSSEGDIALNVYFNEFIDTSSVNTGGFRIQDSSANPAHFEYMEPGCFVITQENDSTDLSIQMSDEKHDTIWGWSAQKLYLCVSTWAVTDLSGNPVIEISTSNALQIDKSVDVSSPSITGVFPKPGSEYVPCDTVVKVYFSAFLKEEQAVKSIVVRQLRDSVGNSVEKLIDGKVTYSGSGKVISYKATRGFPGNSLIEVTVSKEYIKNFIGNSIYNDYSWRFTTNLQMNDENIIYSPSGNIKLFVPAGQFPSSGIVGFTEGIPPNKPAKASIKTVNTANYAEGTWEDVYHYPIDDLTSELLFYSEKGKIMDTVFNKNAELTFDYSGYLTDKDSDYVGFEDKPPVLISTLKIYYLDNRSSRWIPLNSEIDEDSRTISTSIRHFSVYALMGSENFELELAHPYPVPYKPSERPQEFENTLRAGITFTKLPSECDIEIFTIAGRLVNSFHHSDSDLADAKQPGNYYWFPVENSFGEKIASGVYIYYMESEGNSKSGKLMIIR
ncbi:MAG: VCBS repeat-containing protein [Elusimicrobia bacterium]|nr:VCBS repeat-containing protein [Elusimicrobiota bacterium]